MARLAFPALPPNHRLWALPANTKVFRWLQEGVERVKEHLLSAAGEAACCMICLESIRPADPVWSCQGGCYAVMHLPCIQVQGAGWACAVPAACLGSLVAHAHNCVAKHTLQLTAHQLPSATASRSPGRAAR